MIRRLEACLLLILLPVGALAQVFNAESGVLAPKAVSSGYTGPGDIVSFTAWWGLRAYSGAIAAAAAQKLFNARRASDNETCDFIVTTAGGIGNSANCSGADNGVSLATFLTATTGSIVKWYDQTGGGRDVSQGTAGNQPAIVLNCINTSLPCGQSTEAAMVLAAASNFTPATGLASFSTVANRAAGTGVVIFVSENALNNRFIAPNGTANRWQLSGSSAYNVTANDAAWHAGNAVMNGASSVVNIDGTETTGTAAGNTTALPPQVLHGAASTTIDEVEAGFLDNAGFTSGQRSSLHSNQSAYWGTP